MNLRSVVAVVAGFLAVVVLSLGTDVVLHALGVYPPWGQTPSDSLLLLATTYRSLFNIAGGWVTARLAPSRPMRHVWVLAGLGLLGGALGCVASWNKPELGPHWYPVSLVVTAIPFTWAGGWLHDRLLRAR